MQINLIDVMIKITSVFEFFSFDFEDVRICLPLNSTDVGNNSAKMREKMQKNEKIL